MQVKPTYVVLTGADDHTDLSGMQALARHYPVEWGVLLSPKLCGEGRYPTRERIAEIASLSKSLRLSAHLCGAYARSVCADGMTPALKGIPRNSFRRIQINVGPTPTDLSQLRRYAASVGASRAIVQWRHATFPVDDAVDWLYDTSGGTGERPASWPTVVPRRQGVSEVGYAGGIGPSNVLEVIGQINAGNPRGLPFFIDMESSLRTDDRFDLATCEAVLRAVYP